MKTFFGRAMGSYLASLLILSVLLVEVREDLLGAAPWQQWRAATLVAPLMDLPLEKGGETQRFYRAVESSPGAGSESGRK